MVTTVKKQTAKKTTPKKTLAQRLADAEAHVNKIKAQLAEKGLEATSPGMDKLLTEIDTVCKLNKCKTAVVVKAIVRLKKTGLKFAEKTKRTYKKKTNSPTGTTAKKSE